MITLLFQVDPGVLVYFCWVLQEGARVAQLVSLQPSVHKVPSLIPGDISPFSVALTCFRHP